MKVLLVSVCALIVILQQCSAVIASPLKNNIPITHNTNIAAPQWQRLNPTVSVSLSDISGYAGKVVTGGGANNWLSLGTSTDMLQWFPQDIQGLPYVKGDPSNDKWRVASDPKLGFLVYNQISYITSPDGNNWTWRNASLYHNMQSIMCNGQATCLGFGDGNGFFGGVPYITSDLLNWVAMQNLPSGSGYLSTFGGDFYSFHNNVVYKYSISSKTWGQIADLSDALAPFEGLTVFDMTRGPNATSVLLLGSIYPSPEMAIFMVENWKSVECIAIFEGSANNILYQNGAIVIYSPKMYNSTLNFGKNWNTNTCFTSDPYFNKQCVVRYVNGVFAVVGDDGLLATSKDGAVWTPTYPGVVENIQWLTVGPSNIFYLFTLPLSLSGPTISVYQSPNGVEWTSAGFTITAPGGIVLFQGPMYYPSLSAWICFFFNQDTYQNFPRMSSNLVNWTPLPLPANCPETDVHSIAVGNGIIMLTQEINFTAGWTLRYSRDNGTTWATQPLPSPDAFGIPMVVFGNGKFVITSGNNTLVTANSISWTIGNIGGPCERLQYFGNSAKGVFFCGKYFSTPTMASQDGLVWTTLKLPLSFTTTSVTLFDGQNYIISAPFSSNMMISSDGYQWTVAPSFAYLGLDFSASNAKVGVLVGVQNSEIYNIALS